MADWKEVRLGDVADLSWGDTKTTKKSYVKSGWTAYSASGPDGFLDHADYHQTGVVISAIGAQCGKTWLARGEWSCIKNTLRFFATDATVDTEFLYWATCQPSTWPQRGSAQPFISQEDARNVVVPIPPLPEQRAIAEVLGALDDKIESNRRMRDLVLALADGLYGRTLSDGLRVRTLDDVATFHNRGRQPLSAKQRSEMPGNYPYFGATGVFDFIDSFLFDKVHVLVGEDGSVVTDVGSPVTQYVWGKYWVNNHAHVLSGSGITDELLYVALRRADVRPAITGAVQAKLSMGNLKGVELELPEEARMGVLERQISDLFAILRASEDESSTLAQLRDTLLPALLSGRIRVPVAAELVEAS